ncbi:MAG: pyridoxine 5'-phosphate synthase [Bdellovibrionales bacterium]|nr:pyridoxine 5'-phosphate synthase [Bdellovibrionales bacterium]
MRSVEYNLPQLGVNIDHIATLRQLRGTPYPSITETTRLAVEGGADQITIHLREDRRHIQDSDVREIRALLGNPLRARLNFEMAANDEMLKIARKTKPEWACLVPEKRLELTTEGGLALDKNERRIRRAIEGLKSSGIHVSLFIEPTIKAVRISQKWGADAVELHTGRYCLETQRKGASSSAGQKRVSQQLKRIEDAARAGIESGILVHAGHGFDYENVRAVAALTNNGAPMIREYNIGHAIVCRAAMVGLSRAVREMKSAILAP